MYMIGAHGDSSPPPSYRILDLRWPEYSVIAINALEFRHNETFNVVNDSYKCMLSARSPKCNFHAMSQNLSLSSLSKSGSHPGLPLNGFPSGLFGF